MALQWSTIRPTEPGIYWAAYKDRPDFKLVELLPSGQVVNENVDAFDLWAWPVEVPPAPVRPQKEVKDATDLQVSSE